LGLKAKSARVIHSSRTNFQLKQKIFANRQHRQMPLIKAGKTLVSPAGIAVRHKQCSGRNGLRRQGKET
jgi:hypothetical protein